MVVLESVVEDLPVPVDALLLAAGWEQSGSTAIRWAPWYPSARGNVLTKLKLQNIVQEVHQVRFSDKRIVQVLVLTR